MAYTAHGCQSYATISSSLRHDERAIWAHIEPLLKDVRERCSPPPTTLHVMSDGPVTQYRNKKNFYLLSTVPFLSGIKRVTWNFAEKSHGKGAPDGVGGAVKRVADSAVQGGADVQTPEHLYKLLKEKESSIKYYWISDEDIKRYDEALPDSVLAVKGTLKIHQVTTAQPGKIQHREISCFCSRPDICQCHNPSEVDFQKTTKVPPTSLQAKENPKDLNGKFVLVEYDGQPFVGQVLKVVGNEIEIVVKVESNPTDAQDTVCDSNHTLNQDESTDQTSTESLDSVCNAGEQQILNTRPLNMCSVTLLDCRKLMEMKTPQTEEEEHHTDEDDDDDFIPSDESGDSCGDGETASTSKQRLTAQSLSCITCGKTFSSQRRLETHERKHTEQKLFTCTRCDISFPTLQEKKLHSQEHRDKKHFHCQQCGKNCVSTSSLKRHMRTHGDEKPFHCSECDKYFGTKGSLVVHQRIHTGEKTYDKKHFNCERCGKIFFTTSSNMEAHMRTHGDEKSFHCSECDKYFSTKGNLVAHQRIHTGEKPYACPHCEKKFNHKPHLTKHVRIHTNEKPYQCSECGKTFRESADNSREISHWRETFPLLTVWKEIF
ncbi:hypothetical protein E1301_Tti014312 [Triplophysa tibetana]|uniref:C2H2-type domain-containing protein n=1 Tax=Triplophysa tibetana TaxID=1572043 RepID=A0A5A9PIG9_9TELE|nr:hypothetical protein E1301_Tti014312 [Triplophysa tibetana]